MTRRIAASMALLAFAICVTAGLVANNPLSTILSRALVALAGTLVIGLLVGSAAEKMLDEHVAATRKKMMEREISEAKVAPKDR